MKRPGMGKTVVFLCMMLLMGICRSIPPCGVSAAADKFVAGGWTSVSTDDPGVVEAARQAVSMQAAASHMKLKLSSVKAAKRQVVAGLNYRLLLSVMNNGKLQSAAVVVWAKLDGAYELTQWSWSPAETTP